MTLNQESTCVIERLHRMDVKKWGRWDLQDLFDLCKVRSGSKVGKSGKGQIGTAICTESAHLEYSPT